MKALGNSLNDELLLSLFVQGLRQTEVKAHLMIEIMMMKVKSFKEAMEFTDNMEDTCIKPEVERKPRAKPEQATPQIQNSYPKSQVVIKSSVAANRNNYSDGGTSNRHVHDNRVSFDVRKYDCKQVDIDIEDGDIGVGDDSQDNSDVFIVNDNRRSWNYRRQRQRCRFCGGSGHYQRNCRLMDVTCFNCEGRGHYRINCPKRLKTAD